MKNYSNISLNSLPDRELEIIGSIAAEHMAILRQRALEKFKASVEIPGFRKGNAPDILVFQKVGEMRLLQEAAEIALSEEYTNILNEHNIDAIGRPQIQITKLAPGNDLEFKVKTALAPEVKLGDYKKIAKTENAKEKVGVSPTEKEIDEVILNIRRNYAHQKMHNEGLESGEHNHPEISDKDLPELNDQFVKIIADFTSISEFRSKIAENITKEKEIKEKDKKRTDYLEEIIKSSTIEIPKIIVEAEQEKMLAQFKDDIGKAGIPFEEYLKHIKKTENDLKEEWKETAIKRAKSQIVLNFIAKEEHISPKEEDVKKEIDFIVEHYKEADRFQVRMYVETYLTNDLTFEFLEKEK
jgi:FKBP-type peptidyl-prolyl cis-trans isomerase (trigger factor)